MPTTNSTSLPLQTLDCAHAALSWTLASSPKPPSSQSESNMCHHYIMVLSVWHWVSLWEALMKYPREDMAQQGCCCTLNCLSAALCLNMMGSCSEAVEPWSGPRPLQHGSRDLWKGSPVFQSSLMMFRQQCCGGVLYLATLPQFCQRKKTLNFEC